MRYYGRDRNIPEDPACCIARVSEPPHYIHSHQCSRKRGYGPDGLYCKQHAKLKDQGRYVAVPSED